MALGAWIEYNAGWVSLAGRRMFAVHWPRHTRREPRIARLLPANASMQTPHCSHHPPRARLPCLLLACRTL
eukprot:363940-Chlamydomonas_euryale.AAC.1